MSRSVRRPLIDFAGVIARPESRTVAQLKTQRASVLLDGGERLNPNSPVAQELSRQFWARRDDQTSALGIAPPILIILLFAVTFGYLLPSLNVQTKIKAARQGRRVEARNLARELVFRLRAFGKSGAVEDEMVSFESLEIA
ncbi:unnamed protein product [Polarella glacialis]|nr:unnamed protein product [Polarella glacialis]